MTRRLSTRRRNGAPRVSFSDQLSDTIAQAGRTPTTPPSEAPVIDHEHAWYRTRYPDGRKCPDCQAWQMAGTY